TEFHSTIRVDGEEINRFPSPLALWSLRDDARPAGVHLRLGPEEDVLTAAHTGSRRLADPVTVARTFQFSRREPRLVVRDEIDGRGEHVVEFFFHAAPGARIDVISEKAAVLRWPDGAAARIAREAGPGLAWEERAGWFSPSYGVRIQRPVLVASARVKLPLSAVWRLSLGA
ncbi:MAG: heparinase II/III domain-containing protein, partial [Thermoanaerobaculia bacterium]